MTPKGPGGRRKNAWNPSWDRKLVRLWVLSKLTREEIKTLFSADGFDPCLTDIRKRLKLLLPAEYDARSHRAFRPLDDGNMKLRFRNLRRCRSGRISKRQRGRQSMIMGLTSNSRPQSASKMGFDYFVGDGKAFKSYGTSSELIVAESCSELPDTQLVNPFSLMLDGSMVPKSGKPNKSGMIITANDLVEEHCQQLQTQQIDRERTQQESPQSSTPPKKRLNKLDRLHTLRTLLSNNYSREDLKHFDRVLVRLSLSNTSNSTLVSLSSRASTLLSNVSMQDLVPDASSESSLRVRSSTTRNLAGNETAPEAQFWSQVFEILEEKDEDENWRDWIEDNATLPASKIPSYYNVTLHNRRCCMQRCSSSSVSDSTSTMCEKCGLLPEHRVALGGRFPDRTIWSNIDAVDFYGNTLLHCAAESAAASGGLGNVGKLIQRGVDVSIRNTFGETFFHILCAKGPPISANDHSEFLEILRLVSQLKFPFSQPDYHGRTALHRFSHHSTKAHSVSFLSRTYNPEFLQNIFLIINPNLSWQDNSGSRVDHFLQDLCSRISNDRDNQLLMSFENSFQGPASSSAYFKPSQDNISLATSWLRVKQHPSCVLSFDNSGNTPLTSILKHWRRPRKILVEGNTQHDISHGLRDIVEQMVDMGAEINMRDRRGDNALSIAAQGGHLAVMTFLLSKGANVQTRNYRGVGILQQLEWLRHANAADCKLWAALLSCHAVLCDHGALDRPTSRDEWMLPSLRKSDLRPSRFMGSSPTVWPSSTSTLGGSTPKSNSSQEEKLTPGLDSAAIMDIQDHRSSSDSSRNTQPAISLPTTNVQPSSGATGTFKSFDVNIDAPTYQVLPEILAKYSIDASPEQYTLYIEYGNMERCLGMNDRPLAIFERKHREGKKPMFVLQPTARSRRLSPPLQPIFLKMESL